MIQNTNNFYRFDRYTFVIVTWNSCFYKLRKYFPKYVLTALWCLGSFVVTPVFNSSVQYNQSQVPVWFTTYWSEASLTWALFLYGSAFSEYCWSTTHWVWSVNVSDMWGSLPPTLSNTSHKNVVKCHHLYLFIVYLASISSRVQNYIISRSKKKWLVHQQYLWISSDQFSYLSQYTTDTSALLVC